MIPGGDGMVPGGGITTRALLAADAKNWTRLGSVTGPSGVTVGPIVWVGTFAQIYFQYFISGYNGGTPVGRLLCGAGTPSTTGLTNGNGLMEGGTPNATSVSVPGCPLAVTLSLIARAGHGVIMGASGVVKKIVIAGMEGPFAANASPVIFNAASAFDDLGTNLPIQQLQLTVYDTLTATSVSAQTFGGSTSLIAWGRNSD